MLNATPNSSKLEIDVDGIWKNHINDGPYRLKGKTLNNNNPYLMLISSSLSYVTNVREGCNFIEHVKLGNNKPFKNLLV